MSTTANKFNSFVQDLAHKEHDLETDQIKIALTNVAPSATNTVLTDLTEITYTNLSTRDITTTSSGQTSGVYKLVLTNISLTSTGGSTGPFRYIVLYNDTATSDKLIAWYDYGSALTLQDGEALVVAFDGTDGAISIT